MEEKNNFRATWITWESQVRNRSLSHAIGAELFELTGPRSRWLKYPALLVRTSVILLATRNKTVIVQNPSLVLALFSNVFGRLIGKRVVIDSHNGGLFPLEGKYILLNWLAKLVLYSSEYTVVTNKALARYVRKFSVKAIVVPDPLPNLQPIVKSLSASVAKNIVFICTWAGDEPYVEVIKAAKMLPDNIHLHITGRYNNKYQEIKDILPKNVFLKGYLKDEDYLELLNLADVIIDLTTREHCLVCGAYESTALEKPMILSDTFALREYFFQGAVFTDNTADDIARKILFSLESCDDLIQEVRELKKKISVSWKEALSDFQSIIR